jgi:hypothetical protein
MKLMALSVASTLFVGLAAIAGCSSDKSAGAAGATGSGGAATGGSGPLGPPVGTFVITLNAADPSTNTAAFTSFLGIVRDGAPNELTLWDTQSSVGECQLITPRQPFCSSECASGSACIADGVCNSDPTTRSVGTVTVTGLMTAASTTEFVIEPVAPKFNYVPLGSVDILNPPCAEGAEIRVATSGGDFAPFEVLAAGIIPLELLGADPIAMQRDQPLLLTWTPKGTTGVSRIGVKVDISHHGGTTGQITCDVDDTGSLAIAASLVNHLMDLGVAGFPTVLLTRRTTGRAPAPAQVTLGVVSNVERALSIPGLVSCSIAADCPSGQTCLSSKNCS